MRLIYVFIYCLSLTPFCYASYQLELEHTYAEVEGSSWGIEGVLKHQLEIPESELPDLFKVPLHQPSPMSLSLKDQPLTKNYFIQDTMFLYQKMNICMDQNIHYKNDDFDSALKLFLNKVSQVNPKNNALKITFTPINFDNVHPSLLEKCDVLSFIGKKNQFPFLQVQDQPAPHFSTTPQLLLGMYFRSSDTTIPVIVFNPSLQLDFHPKQPAYIQTNDRNEVAADARILFFHELGHLIGFAHLKEGGSWKPFSALTVMGVNSTQDEKYAVDFRYKSHFDIWENWDLHQTSIYRATLARLAQGESSPLQSLFFNPQFYSNSFCFLPEESLHIAFPPLAVDGLTGEDTPDVSGAIPRVIDLTQSQATKSSNAESLTSQYSIGPHETLNIIEFRNTTGTAFFNASNLERSFSEYPSVDTDAPSPSDRWFMLSLSGQIAPRAAQQFNLSSYYRISQNIRLGFTLIRLNIQENQANCYRNTSQKE